MELQLKHLQEQDGSSMGTERVVRNIKSEKTNGSDDEIWRISGRFDASLINISLNRRSISHKVQNYLHHERKKTLISDAIAYL